MYWKIQFCKYSWKCTLKLIEKFIYKMLWKYYKFNTQSTMSIKSCFIWNICFKYKYFRNICTRVVQLFPRVLCFESIYTDQYLDSRYIWENISQTIKLVMLYNYKRNLNVRCSARFFVTSCLCASNYPTANVIRAIFSG